MGYVLEIECIDDDVREAAQRVSSMPPHLHRALLRRAPWVAAGVPPTAWAARILSDGRREFVDGAKDYSRADGTGRRGVFRVFVLREGETYEINAPLERGRARRYRARIERGELVEV